VSALRYHAHVIRIRGRSSATTTALIACALMLVAIPAHAESTLPANADVRIGSTVTLETFTHAVATRYHVELRRVVAADIDRDGDVDFIAATDAGLRVWVNDGSGRLTARTPRNGSTPTACAPGVAWNGENSRRELSVQNELPAPRVDSPYAHAPPPAVSTIRSPLQAARVPSPVYGIRTPRAPPR
jgi:hypothetical protein